MKGCFFVSDSKQNESDGSSSLKVSVYKSIKTFGGLIRRSPANITLHHANCKKQN